MPRLTTSLRNCHPPPLERCQRHLARYTSKNQELIPAHKQRTPGHKERITAAAAELASLPQWCTGSIHLKQKTSLCYKSGPEALFPDPQSQDNDEQASCARFDADSMLINFDLTNYEVLDIIRVVLFPRTVILTAELQELTVYRKEQQVQHSMRCNQSSGEPGSLLLYIPLIQDIDLNTTKDHKDWQYIDVHSIMDPQAVQWFAYSETCDMKNSPNLRGPCITLSYKLRSTHLFNEEPKLPGFLAEGVSIKHDIIKRLIDPDFLPNGGRIGIPCRTIVPHTDGEYIGDVPSMLQGRDAVCLQVLKQLGLKCRVLAAWDLTKHVENLQEWYWAEKPGSKKPVYQVHYPEDDEPGSIYICDLEEDGSMPFLGRRYYVPVFCITELSHTRRGAFLPWTDIYKRTVKEVKEDAICRFLKKSGAADVVWLDDEFTWFAKQTVGAFYRREMFNVMSAPVILVQVPAWGSEQRWDVLAQNRGWVEEYTKFLSSRQQHTHL